MTFLGKMTELLSDEDFYDKVKVKLGMRIGLDFYKRHGKRVGSFAS